MARCSIRAKTPDHSRDTRADDFAQLDLRCSRCESSFATAADQVNMWIDQARGYDAVARVDDIDLETQRLEAAHVDRPDFGDLRVEEEQ